MSGTKRRKSALKGLTIAAAAVLLSLSVPSASAAEGPDISGVVETRATGAQVPDYGEGEAASFGMEQYANLRLKAAVGERGTLYAATNLIAAAGDQAFAVDPFVVGENYAAALELERLYYRIRGDAFDLQVGLQRLPFGFGQAFRPSDFLAPPNPLLPDARPRGVLGGAAFFYPRDEWKVSAFTVAGKDAAESSGEGIIMGVSTDIHTQKTSLQALYAIQADSYPVHRFGLSGKLETGASFTLDALYTLDGSVVRSGDYYDRSWNGLQGLDASLGADYSILGGDLYMVCQYLYHGAGALDPDDDLGALYLASAGDWTEAEPASRVFRGDIPLSQLNRRDYFYAGLTYRWNDYTSTSLSCVAGLDDLSFSPSAQVEHEPFQGLTLGFSLRVPLDLRTFSNSGDYGELGPTQTGMRYQGIATAKLKF